MSTLEQRVKYLEKQLNGLKKETNQESVSDWFERGELPPVGSIVQFYNNLDYEPTELTEQWDNGDILEVLSHQKVGKNDVVVCWNKTSETACSLVRGCVKPLKSERERFVEAATSVFFNGSNCEQMAEALYDAGCRFTDNNK